MSAYAADRVGSALRSGHHLMCANERQRDLWLGAMVGAGLVILLISVYIVVNAACLGYFLRTGRFHPIRHGLIPVLGIAAFIPAWLTATGIKVFSFISPLTPPISYAAYAVAVFVALGVLYLIGLWRRDRRRVIDVGLVHLDLAPEEAV